MTMTSSASRLRLIGAVAVLVTAASPVAVAVEGTPKAASVSVTRSGEATNDRGDVASPGSLRTVRAPYRPLVTRPFAMVGATWRSGDPQVQVRTRAGSVWSSWHHLDALPGERASEPLWVGDSDAVQLRATGNRRRVRLVLINPGRRTSDLAARVLAPRPVSPAANAEVRGSYRSRAYPPRPPMQTRTTWRANEKWRDVKVEYNKVPLQQVHIHHTASANGYRPGDVPRMIRGMYRYHVKTLGWGDIGYNYLVDVYGRVWIGRAGQQTKLVKGAHTLGFNTTSIGISVIGNFDTAPVPDVVLTSIAEIAAWKLAPTGLNPYGQVRVRSEGSDLFKRGMQVTLPVIDGHRDTNQTACPGSNLYAALGALRERVATEIAWYGGPVWPNPTALPTPTPVPTPTPTGSASPSLSPSPTPTPSGSASSSPSASQSGSPSPSPSASQSGSASPSPTPTVSGSTSPSASPSATPSSSDSPTPTATPSSGVGRRP